MQKTKLKKLIAIISITAALLLAVLIVFLYKHFALKIAISKMDITDTPSVTRVLKLAKNNTDTLVMVAKQYLKTNDQKHIGAAILFNATQNETALSLLKNYYMDLGTDNMFLNQLKDANPIDLDFETVTEYGDTEYGIADGIVAKMFNGTIGFKLSSIYTNCIYANASGVFALDIADSCVKHISNNGITIKTVATDVCEFAYHKGKLYYILNSGELVLPSGKTEVLGNIFKNLRVQGSDVLCDVYDSELNALHTATLN